ncbi:MAG: hypothetical protein ACI8X5_001448 [Planctomycetota bacterium]|jgi:hypothetical protein
MNHEQFPSALRRSLSLGFVFAFGSTFASAAQVADQGEMPSPQEGVAEKPATEIAQKPEVMVGEKLNPLTAFGPAVIESMEIVLEREKANPSSTENQKSRGDSQGSWAVPSMRSSFHAHSGEHYLINKWGDALMTIEFQAEVAFEGAWLSGHADNSLWAEGVRFIGYHEGERVAESAWLEKLEDEGKWLSADFDKVDRIDVEARAVYRGGGWYGLDDLTFVKQADSERVVIDFDDLGFNTKLFGSGYAGLVWPKGRGDFDQEAETVHKPVIPAGLDVEGQGAESMIQNSNFLGGSGTAPTLTDSFNGPRLGDTGAGWLPPDTHGSIGPTHFVAVVNQNMSVYERDTHARVMNVGLANFFGTGGASAGDPRAVYDPHSDRFFVIAVDFDTRLWFAMSMTSDPTGSWFKSSIVLSQGADASRWPDYPTLGVDENGVYSASYMVEGGGQMSIFAIDKAPLLNVLPSLGAVTAFRNLPWEGAIQPCVTYGNPGREYLVSRRSSTTMRLRYIQAPLSNPTLVEAGNPSVPGHSSPPNAPAMGSVAPLDALDWRPMNAVYRNGSVWTAHGVNSGGRAACRWYEFDASSATTVQSGTINDPSLNYMFGTIEVNANDEVVVAFSGSDENTFASSYFAGRIPSDPPGQLSVPELLKAGNDSYNFVDSSGVNRWGDYSNMSIDPNDDTSIWAIQEHTRSQNNWGTRIAKFEFAEQCPDPSNYCLTSANSVGSGALLSFNGSSSLTLNSLQLNVQGLPVSTPGLFYYGPNQTAAFFGDGLRCVGGSITRLSPLQGDVLGTVSLLLDLNSAPFDSGSGEAIEGSTMNFQYWYRDPNAGGAGFNLTDGLSVTFCP